MVQYWIQTPIENALEVVQRFMNDPSHALTGWQGKDIYYEPPTEVVFYPNDINNWQLDSESIYFGNFYFCNDENGWSITVGDGVNDLIVIDTFNTMKAGVYANVIWNNLQGLPFGNVYFAGYQFKVTYPEQVQTILRVMDYSNTPCYDIGTILNSQDDTPVTIADEAGNKVTFSIYQTPTISPVHIEAYDFTLQPGWYEIKSNSYINYADLCYACGNDLMDLEIINAQQLTYLNIPCSSTIPITSLDKILSQLAGNGKSNGTFIYPNNGWDPTGSTDYDTLISRGWTITL
jgi:hypothetical protein